MHVSLTAEPLIHLGPLTITNSLFTTWLVITVIAIFAIIFKLRIKKHPRGIQNLVEAIVECFYGIVESVAENPKLTRKFFAPIFTIFLFVLLNNWAGLIPGVGSVGISHTETTETHHEEIAIFDGVEKIAVTNTDHTENAESHEKATHEEPHSFTPIFRPGSADLSFTLALAAVAILMVQFMGVRQLGGWGYFKRFLNFSNPVHFFVGLLEIISEFSKMVSFSFRLFGNIFAGEVLLTVIIALAPFVAPMPFYALEIFVGAVQALVFAMLTLVFFRMATSETH
ncbi:F0F1 ATP synthase subunit A [Candidatus Gracilibacteria bacterium]|nr:F0F1 ATP synthase subunit A [Candidatus Gracilibacteria bacterium]